MTTQVQNLTDSVYMTSSKIYAGWKVEVYTPENHNRKVYEVHEFMHEVPGSTIVGIVNSERAANEIVEKRRVEVLASDEYRQARV